MKSFIFPVIVALLGFALVTLADFGDSDAEEAKIIEDFENGMFDSFITIQTEVNDDDDNNDDDDDDLEDVEEPQDRYVFEGIAYIYYCLHVAERLKEEKCRNKED